MYLEKSVVEYGGDGIRTHGALADTLVFKPSRVSFIAMVLSGLVKHNCQNYANLDFDYRLKIGLLM